MDSRARRIAENEGRVRAINERLEQDLRRLPPVGEPLEFVCECGSADCTRSVLLLLDEFEGVRADSTTFAVLPGHEISDVEDVVARHDRYYVVRKHPPTRPVVEASDRRA